MLHKNWITGKVLEDHEYQALNWFVKHLYKLIPTTEFVKEYNKLITRRLKDKEDNPSNLSPKQRELNFKQREALRVASKFKGREVKEDTSKVYDLVPNLLHEPKINHFESCIPIHCGHQEGFILPNDLMHQTHETSVIPISPFAYSNAEIQEMTGFKLNNNE